MNDKRVLVVGIGSPHGDDQAGWLVIDQLQEMVQSLLLDGLQPVDLRLAKSPVDLLDWIDGTRHLIICDACRGLGEQGSIHRYCWPVSEQIEIETSGTHNLNLKAVLTLAATLGRLPKMVELFVIEGESARGGEKPSAIVTMASAQLVKLLVNQLSKTQSAASCTNGHS